MRVLSVLVILAILCAGSLVLADSADGPALHSAQAPIASFVFGVYWPWERTDRIANNVGVEKWAFVQQTCEMLGRSGVNTIWVVNIGSSDTKRLAAIAGKAHIELLPCIGEIEPHNCGGTMGMDPKQADFHAKAIEYYRKTIPQVVQELGPERANIRAWVLCDEPSGPFADLMEPMRQIFVEADPERPVTAVSMWVDTPNLVAKTRLTTFCVDLYPFFSAGNPNGPNRPDSSRNFLTSNAQAMVDAAGKDGRTGLLMPQCYNEIWGPYRQERNGSLTALPGAFVHWRTPTPAEIRWQIWEGLRLGVKGTVFFCLLGPGESNEKAAPITDPALQSLIVRQPTPVGPASLLDQNGLATSQFSEMSALYVALGRQRELLRRLKRIETDWLTAAGGTQTGSFEDPKTGRMFVVVVNPDFDRPAEAMLTAHTRIRKVRDVLGRSNPSIHVLTDGSRTFTVSLTPGSGAILEISRSGL